MKWTYTTLLLIAGLFASPFTQAAEIEVSLVAGTLTGNPLDVLVFQGALTNISGGDLFVNGATLSLAGFGPSDSDLVPFILNASGPLSMDASIGPVDFFTVTIPNMFSSGQYAGMLSVQGGVTEIDDSVLGSVPFGVNVQPVPEPGSLLLLFVGILALLSFRRLLHGRTTTSALFPGIFSWLQDRDRGRRSGRRWHG